LPAAEDQGKDGDTQVNLEEKTIEFDQGQARSNPDPGVSRVALVGPNPEPTHKEIMAIVYLDVYGSLKLLVDKHVILEEPLSSSETLSSMKNLDDAYTFGDQFLNDKSNEDEPGKLNMDSEVVSMVMVLIHQVSSSVSPLSTLIIDLFPPRPVPATTYAPIFTATTTPKTPTRLLPSPLPQQSTSDSELAALEQKLAAFEQKSKTLNNTAQNLRSRVFNLQLLGSASQDQPNPDIKELLHQRMFESGSYKSLPEHVALYEALEASMDRANRDEFLAKKDKSQKRRHDDKDPPPPPAGSDPSKRRKHNSGSSGSTQPPVPQSSAWKTSDT
nr:hypothetical protein [Tanacetum cinerariifolium]